jgi:hypothetical protein
LPSLNVYVIIPAKLSTNLNLAHFRACNIRAFNRWTIDKLDLEVNSRRWTFYVNPQSHTSVDETAVVQPVGELKETDQETSSLTAGRNDSVKSDELLYIKPPRGS